MGTLYPWRAYGFHLKAGVGLYWYLEETAEAEVSTNGLALQASVGFDIKATGAVSLSPFASLVASGFGNPTRMDKASGQRLPLLSEMTVRFLQLGVAAVVH